MENQSLFTRNYAVLYYQTSKEIPWPQKLEKLKKMSKIFKKKLQKLVSFCVFVFVVPKHIAHKMAILSNFVAQKAFISC